MQPKKQKSVSIKIKGTCGHTYTHRVNLTDIFDVAADKFESYKQQSIEKATAVLSERECNNCLNLSALEKVKESNEGIMRSLSMSSLPPIETGSLGQKVWAEEIRNSHLQHLIFLSISIVGGVSIAEEIAFGDKYKNVEYSTEIKEAIVRFKDIVNYISDTGYLGYVFNNELDGDETTSLRRLLILRALVNDNIHFFKEDRHTSWIMHQKNGKTPYNTRFKQISPNYYFSIMLILGEKLDNLDTYEMLAYELNLRARADIQEIIASLDSSSSTAEKMDLINVYQSLQDKDQELPF